MNKLYLYLILVFGIHFCESQNLAVLKYDGGGDWYSNPTALKNLIAFCNTTINTTMDAKPHSIEIGSPAIFEYPFVHMTGHGNVVFSESDSKNLRDYLLSGGFLHIDDNYGMKPYVLEALKTVFPDKKMTEIPLNHPIYTTEFSFPKGLPKIHEHDGLAPRALGYFHEGKLVLLFTYESDLGDGWEDASVHNDPESVRLKALKMGANIIKYAFEN
ncbi:MAG: DUF4159 domain-containing protein [Flavobacteriaceae bacterium]|jgi:hypothetical protein|nr:DUF4159 domain-containing protein [Flavobacteriaceae bacterium]